MMSLNALLHLGDLKVTVAAAAALTAWLMIRRTSRAALWWSGLFTLGISLVGASKIAFIGWGTGLPSLDFRAVSGHAAGVTALLPSIFYWMLHDRGRGARTTGVIAGLLLGTAMGVLLVLLDQHSATEAFAGWTMGALVSLGAIGMAGGTHQRNAVSGLLRSNLSCCALVFVLAASMMQSVSVGSWMTRVALLLSGNPNPHRWDMPQQITRQDCQSIQSAVNHAGLYFSDRERIHRRR